MKFNENENQKTYYELCMNTNDDEYDRDYEPLFFICESYDEPEADSVVSLYLQIDTAYLFCFFGDCFKETNIVDVDLTFPKSDGLFITVSYKQAVEILSGMGYLKEETDTASFGFNIDDIRQRTITSIYRECWKRVSQ